MSVSFLYNRQTLNTAPRAAIEAGLRTMLATHAPEFTLRYFTLFEKFNQRTYTAVLECDGTEFVYVPGDTVTLGWETWAVGPAADSWQEIVTLFDGSDGQALAYIRERMSPVRRVNVPPMIVERTVRETGYFSVSLNDSRLTENTSFAKGMEALSSQSRECSSYTLHETFRLDKKGGEISAFLYEPASYDDVVDAVVSDGFRLPTEDEWEYLCGGGSRTLYPWGDSMDYSKNYAHLTCCEGGEADYLATPNHFGLVIANDPYRYEVTMDSAWFLKAGDGGCTLCGGGGPDLGYLPIATFYRDPLIFDEEMDFKSNIAGDYTFTRRIKRLVPDAA